MKSAETLKQELLASSNRIDEELKNPILTSEDRERVSKTIKGEFRTIIVTLEKLVFERDQPDAFYACYGEECTEKAKSYCSSIHKYNVLVDLTKLANPGHHTSTYQTEDETRTVLPMIEGLPLLREFAYKEFNILIIRQYKHYPLDLDRDSINTYVSLVNAVAAEQTTLVDDEERYVVTKQSLRHVSNQTFYEISLAIYGGNASKYTSFLAFSIKRVSTPYPIRITKYKSVEIVCLGIPIRVMVILDYEVSIPYPALNGISACCNIKRLIQDGMSSYQRFMSQLTERSCTVLQFLEGDFFDETILKITEGNKRNELFIILSSLRNLIKPDSSFPFRHTLRYLLCTMEESDIAACKIGPDEEYRGEHFFSKHCYAFEKQPQVACLPRSITKISTILEANPISGKPEIELAMHMHRNPRFNNRMFVPIKEFSFLFSEELSENDLIQRVKALVQQFNQSISDAVANLRLGIFGRYLYPSDKVNNIGTILDSIHSFQQKGISGYGSLAKKFLATADVDDPAKRFFLENAFLSSSIAFLCGPAGTGKSKTIELFGEMTKATQKCVVTNTKAALSRLSSSMKERGKAKFKTLKRFLYQGPGSDTRWVIFDECAVISNRDIARALKKCSGKDVGIIMVGDPGQLESVEYGGWFNFIIQGDNIFRLEKGFRTEDAQLKALWSRVRNINTDDDCRSVKTILQENHIVHPLGKDITGASNRHDVILCLNYEGIYGINFLNRLLQCGNPEPAVFWRHRYFKKGDPVIFTAKDFFGDRLDESVRGVLYDVGLSEDKYAARFVIQLDKPISASPHYQLVERDGENYMVFIVDKRHGPIPRNRLREIPFQIAYAISIHKSQGLEFENVGIIISKNVEEFITKNVFYTAITRAEKTLSIYWTPEAELYVLNHLATSERNDDYKLLKMLKMREANTSEAH